MTPYRIFVLLTCTLFAGNVSAWGALAGFPPVRIIDYSTGMPYWRGTASDASETPDVTNRQQSGEVRVSPVTTAASCNLSAASAEMVRYYAANEQVKAGAVFKQLSAGYFDVMRKLQLPPNDVASAVGAFLVGTVSAYRDIDFPDESVQPLVLQLRNTLANSEQFRSASAEAKSMVCGQLALIGMFMATTRMATKEHPQPEAIAGMRQAAKSYLETFLKTDADRVDISARGLVLK